MGLAGGGLCRCQGTIDPLVLWLDGAMKPSAENFCVVEDEQVARVEKGGKIVKVTVVNTVGLAINHKQPAMVARLHRALGNPFRWQMVVEVVREHGRTISNADTLFSPR